MPNLIAPPNFVIYTPESVPCVVTYAAQYGGLTPTGLAAVIAAVAAYLTAAKKVLIGAEQLRVGGTTVVPAAVLGTSNGSFPVLFADATAQAAALAAIIATGGNAG